VSDPQLDIVILISGRGSNMAAIHAACQDGRLPARIAAVIADRPEAAGLDLARSLGIPAHLVSFRDHARRADFDAALARQIDACTAGPARSLLVLAGFMRILEPEFIGRYRGKMLNIHPSLLPAYRGLHTHRRALADGVAWHGASVHFVSDELDGGPVVAQVRVPVLPGDTETSLSARVQRGEHRLYWRVIGWVAQNRLSLAPAGVQLDGAPLHRPVVWQLPAQDADGDLTDVAN
jgi:phosphoribosylglycinamide formyltransferase-1